MYRQGYNHFQIPICSNLHVGVKPNAAQQDKLATNRVLSVHPPVHAMLRDDD